MTRLTCPDCNGRQVIFREEVLTECGRCLGRGWVSVPSPMRMSGLFGCVSIVAEAGALLGIVWLFIVAATATA